MMKDFENQKREIFTCHHPKYLIDTAHELLSIMRQDTNNILHKRYLDLTTLSLNRLEQVIFWLTPYTEDTWQKSELSHYRK